MADPMNLSTATVRGRFISGIQDGADPDTTPDAIPLSGLKITLEPLIKVLTIPAEVPGERSTIMILESHEYETDTDGLLYNPKNLDSPAPDIRIIASDALTEDPDHYIRWRATIHATGTGIQSIVKTFIALADEVIDLPTVETVPDTPVINLTEWMQLVADARASKDVAVMAAGQASASAAQAVAAAESVGDVKADADAAAASAASAAASKTAAATSATNAGASATAAAGSATSAGQAKTAAETAKTAMEGMVEVNSTLLMQLGNRSGVLDLSAVAKNMIVHLTATGNITSVTLPAAPVVGRIITLVISQDATGGRTIKLPGVALAWGASTDVVLSRTANSVDVLHLMHDGVRWVCLVAAQQIAIPASWAV